MKKFMLAGDEAKLRLGLFDLLQVGLLEMLRSIVTSLSAEFNFKSLSLNSILQNIILIRDPKDARKFYPRFNLEDTTSFQDLDDHRYPVSGFKCLDFSA